MDKRYFLFAATGLALGIALGHLLFGRALYWLIPLAAMALGVVGLLLLGKRRVLAIYALGVVFCLLGGWLYNLRAPDPPPPPEHTALEGKVVSVRLGANLACDYLLENVVVYGQDGAQTALSGRVMAGDVSLPQPALPGQVLRMSGTTAQIPQGPRNPGGFNARLYYLTQGAQYTAFGGRSEALALGEPSGAQAALTRARIRFAANIDLLWPRLEDAAMVRAMLLGDMAFLSGDVREDFSRLGIAHVLSVSGLHMGFIYLLLEGLLRLAFLAVPARYAYWWGRLRHGRYIFTLAGLTAYAALAGFSPPCTRALVLVAWSDFVRLWRARHDPVTTLSGAVLIVLLTNPLDLFSLSFQMSFGSVAAIMLFSQPLQRRLMDWRVPKYLAASMAMTFAAQLGLLPILAMAFGSVPFLGMFANLFAVPLSAAVMMIALPAVLLSFVSPWLASIPAFAATQCVRLLERLSGAAADYIPLASVNAPSPPILLSLLFGVLLLLLSPAGRGLARRTRRILLAGGGACFAALSVFWMLELFPPNPVVTMLDAGQGHATIARRAGDAILIDAGANGAAVDAAQYYNLTFDAAFLSHADWDHTAGLAKLMEAGRIKVLYISRTQPGDGGEMPGLLEAARKAGVPVVRLEAGERIQVGGFDVLVLAPGGEQRSGDNANMLVVNLVYQGQSVALFPGDLNARDETGIDFAPSRILQVAHHGSKYSTSEEMISTVHPQLALIPVGRNTYGHPHADVLERLEDIQVERTDHSGAIEVRVDDELTIRRWGRKR